jgi:hypothetical protein
LKARGEIGFDALDDLRSGKAKRASLSQSLLTGAWG